MASIAFFNNKGGVGKTTLSCNMASFLAKQFSLKVLIIDCDPQCNATQLLLEDRVWEDLYSNRRDSANRTILKALRHIRAGDSEVDLDVHIEQSQRFGCDVLAGHPSLSILEDTLSLSWGEFRQGTPGGARRSMWAATLAAGLKYDLVVFDVGPSLGALNRSVLLGSNNFATPMAADLFSLYALDNISSWMKVWARDYTRARDSLSDSGIEFEIDQLPKVPTVLNGFVGYTVQQYVTKNTGGRLRAVNAYDRYRKQIPDRAAALADFRAPNAEDLDLGVVPNMFSMVPLAQAKHAPIADLTQSDGVRGAQGNQQARYVQRLDDIGQRLASNLGLDS